MSEAFLKPLFWYKRNSASDYWLSFHWDLLLSDVIVPWIQTPWIHCCPGPCRTACTCLWEKHQRTLVSTVSRSRCGPGSWGCCTSHTAPPWNFYLTWRNNKLRYSTKTILFVQSEYLINSRFVFLYSLEQRRKIDEHQQSLDQAGGQQLIMQHQNIKPD